MGMSDDTYAADSTALLVIDPYNDFIAEGGKVWPRISAVAQANHCVQHMLEVLQAARRAGLRDHTRTKTRRPRVKRRGDHSSRFRPAPAIEWLRRLFVRSLR